MRAPKPTLLTLKDVIDLLRQQVNDNRTQAAFALKAGVSQQYVGDILRGQRQPGAKILSALGLQKVILYTEK